jgi:predicted secreted protein
MLPKNINARRLLLPVLMVGTACAIGSISAVNAELTQTKPLPRNPANQTTAELNSVPATAPTAAIESSDFSAPSQRTLQKKAGFSSDGRYYLYLESWRDLGAGIPKSALQVVDVVKNACVETGCTETQYGEVDAGLSLAVAEKNVLQQTQTLRQNLQLETPAAGTNLTITQRSRTPDGTETATVNLGTGKPTMQIQLQQTATVSSMFGGTAPKDQASMQMQVTYGSKTRALGLSQDGTISFSIREVVLSPNGKSIVVLLTSTQRAFEGTLGKTLVQGLEL